MSSFIKVNGEKKVKKLKQKKVNRKKSMAIKVVALGLTVVMLTSLFAAFGGKRKKSVKTSTDYSISNELKNEDKSIIDNDNGTYINEDNIHFLQKSESTTMINYDTPESSEKYIDDEENILVFEYESDETVDSENINQALRYKDLFMKYGEKYGIPWQLLCAMAAQENAGIHDADYSEPAIGIMQIERDALIGHTFNKLYNFETNSFEKFTITNNNGQLEDLYYNIKCGSAELADCIRVAYNVAVKEGKLDAEDGIAYAVQRYNMGGTNMTRTLELEGNWMDNRDFITVGDSRYFEKVFDGLQQLDCDVLCIKYYDEETKEVREVKTRIVNTYNKHLSK